MTDINRWHVTCTYRVYFCAHAPDLTQSILVHESLCIWNSFSQIPKGWTFPNLNSLSKSMVVIHSLHALYLVFDSLSFQNYWYILATFVCVESKTQMTSVTLIPTPFFWQRSKTLSQHIQNIHNKLLKCKRHFKGKPGQVSYWLAVEKNISFHSTVWPPHLYFPRSKCSSVPYHTFSKSICTLAIGVFLFN